MSFDYNAPAELFLAKRTKSRRAKYRSQQRLRPFATPLRIYHHSVLSVPGFRLAMSASAATTFSGFMKAVIIRCASLSDRSARAPPGLSSYGSIESDDVIDYYRFADRLGQPIVSSAPASSASGCRPKH